jgi:hypothetical protein
MPAAVVLPQKVKSEIPTPPIGQRHVPGARSSSEHGSALTTSTTTGSDANSA